MYLMVVDAKVINLLYFIEYSIHTSIVNTLNFLYLHCLTQLGQNKPFLRYLPSIVFWKYFNIICFEKCAHYTRKNTVLFGIEVLNGLVTSS